MCSHTRRAVLAVLLVAALVAVLGAHGATYQLDGNTLSFPSPALNGDTYAYSVIAFQEEGLTISISSATVTGTGVTFQGLPTTSDTESRRLSVMVGSMSVSSSSVTLKGYFPRNTYTEFSSTTGTALTGPLFTLSTLSLAHNASVVIKDSSAAWTSAASQSLVSVTNILSISDASALFVEGATVTGAIKSVFDASTTTVQISTDSVLAVDGGSCTACTGAAVAFGAAPSGGATVTSNSLLRVRTVAAGPGGIATGAITATSDSVVEVSGTVPSTSANYIPSLAPTVDATSRLQLGPFTGGQGMGTTIAVSPGTAYADGTSTAGSTTLSDANLWSTAGISGNVVVTDANGQVNGVCQNIHCLGDTKVLGSDQVCSCACTDGLYAPYCSAVYDPVAANANCDPFPVGSACTSMDSACNCNGCRDGYTLVNNECIADTPTGDCSGVANCKSCCKVVTTTCCECDVGYVLNPDTRLECKLCSEQIPGCTQCYDWTRCGDCGLAYQVSGNTCVLRPTGGISSASPGRTMAIGVLLLIVSTIALCLQ